MIETRSSVDSLPAPGQQGGSVRRQVRFRLLEVATWLELAAFDGTQTGGTTAGLCGLFFGVEPTPSGTFRERDGYSIARIGPSRYAVIGSTVPVDALSSHPASLAVFDMSHAKWGLRISGYAVAVLRKGLKIDLSDVAFPPGRIAETQFQHISVSVLRKDSGTFDIYCSRSFASSLWARISDASLEYGWIIEASSTSSC